MICHIEFLRFEGRGFFVYMQCFRKDFLAHNSQIRRVDSINSNLYLIGIMKVWKI